MEADDRPLKMRKLSHDAIGPERPIVQLSSESEHDLSSENEAASRKGEQDENQSDADNADSTDDGASLKKVKVPRPAGMSKNAWKKLQKKAEWEAGREYRKGKRKELIQAKKARDRAARVNARANDTAQPTANGTTTKSRARKHIKLPVTFLIDCGFDDLMMEKERISLGSQLTRSYSDNNKGPFQAHMVVSSWGGQLKERFDTVLAKHHENWRDVVFTDKDFVEASDMAKKAMSGKHGGEMAGIFSRYRSADQREIDSARNTTQPDLSSRERQRTPEPKSIVSDTSDAFLSGNVDGSSKAHCFDESEAAQIEQIERDGKQAPSSLASGTRLTANLEIHDAPRQDFDVYLNTTDSAPANGQHSVLSRSHSLSQIGMPDPEQGEVIYLTSDSPYTLDELKPYSIYIIGGLVDKNRHKGICYKTACEKGLKTAKLPIGEFMEMRSRFVLATNHVMEIMVRWLECGDWGKAFLDVIPKRKGGKLKEFDTAEESENHHPELHGSSEEQLDKQNA